jgi:outer membrane biosynthesis protein TonB
MFNFINNIFKGIINFFTGLFGGKQSEGKFYKQLEESQEPAPQKPSPEPQPQPAQVSKPEPKPEAKPQPVAANASQNGKVKSANESEKTFAPDYLMPTPSPSRRRPGPSYDMFKDMARQVKTPSA